MIKLHNVQTTAQEVYRNGMEHDFDSCFIFTDLQKTYKLDYRNPASIIDYGCRLVAKSRTEIQNLIGLLRNERLLDEISNYISTGAPRSLRKNNAIIASLKLFEILNKYLNEYADNSTYGSVMIYKGLIYEALLSYGLVLPSTDLVDVEIARDLFPTWNEIREAVLVDSLRDVISEEKFSNIYDNLSQDNTIETIASRLLLDPLKRPFRQLAKKLNRLTAVDHTLSIVGAACLTKVITPGPSTVDYQGLLDMTEFDNLCSNYTFIDAFAQTVTSKTQLDQILSTVVVQDMLERIRVIVNRINTASEFHVIPIKEVLHHTYIRHYADAANVLTGVTVQPLFGYDKPEAAALSIFKTPKSYEVSPITRLEDLEPSLTSLRQSIRNVFSAASIFDKFNNQFIGVFTGISNVRGSEIGLPGDTVDINAQGTDFNAVRQFLLSKSVEDDVKYSGSLPVNSYIMITVAPEVYFRHLAVACADVVLIKPATIDSLDVFNIAYKCTKRVPDTLRLLVSEFNTQVFITSDPYDAVTFSAYKTETKNWVCKNVQVPFRGSFEKGAITQKRKADKEPLVSDINASLLEKIDWSTSYGIDHLTYTCDLFELFYNDTKFEDIFEGVYIIDDLADEFTVHTPLYDAIQLANVFFEVKEAVGTAMGQMLMQIYNSIPTIRILVTAIERKMLFNIQELKLRRKIAENMRQGNFKPDLIIQVIGELLYRNGMIGRALYENWNTDVNPVKSPHVKEFIRSSLVIESVPVINENALAHTSLTHMNQF